MSDLNTSSPAIEIPRVEVPVETRSNVRRRARGRARLMGAVLVLALSGLAARGAQLCVEPSDRVIHAGSMLRYDQVTLRARRGEILDRNGRRLAFSVETPTVAVDPQLITDMPPDEVDALATKLSAILELPKAELMERMQRSGRYVKLASKVHPRVAAEVDDLDVAALWTHRDPQRYYPEENLASQVVGFVDASGHGRAGLEQALDDELRGGTVIVSRRRDRKGLDVDRPAVVALAANQGMDVHTTIDRQIQHIAEVALLDVVATSAPVSASAVVVDVKTGDILAIANVPEFNPNAMPEDSEPRKNHIVVDAIEPGSIFKPFTIAAAMDLGLTDPQDLIDCEVGGWNIGRSRIRDDHPHGVITLGEVMKFSSNIGVAKLAFRMGADKFLPYLHAFGFGELSGVPLPGERRGVVRDAKTIKPIELATTAFGQGTTATPLQLAMGIATLGNDGVRMKPRLVNRIDDAYGVPDHIQKPMPVERAVTAETARSTVAMMTLVTETGGTGTRAQVPGFRVAGKTGTAQKVKDGRYSDARISSFVGLIPADDPVLAIAVIVDEPTQGSRYGGIAAAPAWARIAEESLRYLGVAPDPALLALEPGDAPVVEELPPTDYLDLAWDGDAWTAPDFRGRPVRDVLVALKSSGLAVEMFGSGEAIAQDPPAGTPLTPGQRISVTFQ